MRWNQGRKFRQRKAAQQKPKAEKPTIKIDTRQRAVRLTVMNAAEMQRSGDYEMFRLAWRKGSHCVGCEAQSFKSFLIIKPGRKAAKHWTVTGICESCDARRDLCEVIHQAVRVRFPNVMSIMPLIDETGLVELEF